MKSFLDNVSYEQMTSYTLLLKISVSSKGLMKCFLSSSDCRTEKHIFQNFFTLSGH